jgi:isoleucyl-tRNA synthetase
MAAALRRTGQVELSVDGETVVLTSEEIEVTQTPRTGWAVASRDGITVALDTTITPELRRAGLARDVMRALQQARKNTGLQVSDRVTVWWHADGETAVAVREHAPAIAEEILATTFTDAPGPVDLHPETDPSTGLTYRLRIA